MLAQPTSRENTWYDRYKQESVSNLTCGCLSTQLCDHFRVFEERCRVQRLEDRHDLCEGFAALQSPDVGWFVNQGFWVDFEDFRSYMRVWVGQYAPRIWPLARMVRTRNLCIYSWPPTHNRCAAAVGQPQLCCLWSQRQGAPWRHGDGERERSKSCHQGFVLGWNYL